MFVEKKEYKLRTYQQEAVDNAISFYYDSKETAGLIVAPTASGKSIIITAICEALSDKRIIILQPSKEILEQNIEKAGSYGMEYDVFSHSAGQKTIGNLTYATIMSVWNARNKFHDFDLIIIDEAHLVNPTDGQYFKLINKLGCKVIGLTATPCRLGIDIADNERINGNYCILDRFPVDSKSKRKQSYSRKIFTEMIYDISLDKMYEGNYLSKTRYVISSPDDSMLKLNQYGSDFTSESIDAFNKANDINNQVKDIIDKEKEVRSFLVFVPLIADGNMLIEYLSKHNISADIITAETSKIDREQKLEQFKSGKIRVMANVGTMTTGYDYPGLDCIILARKTVSLSLYIQMVGRGVRVADGKKECVVYDIVNNAGFFGRFETMKVVKSSDIDSGYYIESETGILTGVPTKVRIAEIERKKKQDKCRKSKEGMADIKIPFGKYRGEIIYSIPDSYLSWISKTIDIAKTYRDLATKELFRRKMMNDNVDDNFKSKHSKWFNGKYYGSVIREVGYLTFVTDERLTKDDIRYDLGVTYPEFINCSFYKFNYRMETEDKHIYNFTAYVENKDE